MLLLSSGLHAGRVGGGGRQGKLPTVAVMPSCCCCYCPFNAYYNNKRERSRVKSETPLSTECSMLTAAEHPTIVTHVSDCLDCAVLRLTESVYVETFHQDLTEVPPTDGIFPFLLLL